jgi:phosphoribosylamine--glycine ligase
MIWQVIQTSPNLDSIWCAPGNAGIARERLKNGRLVTCVPEISVDATGKQLALAEKEDTELTLVSPEKPLVFGISGLFAASGRRIFGCDQASALFEGSKCMAQNFANKHSVRFASGESFDGPDKAKRYARKLNGKCAVKADELRGGKGVTVCHSMSEAEVAIDAEFGKPNAKVVIQHLLAGREVSLMVVCDGKTAKCFETAQDYKLSLDGDLGEMTGGMGSFSGEPLLSQAQIEEVYRTIINPWLAGCQAEGITFKGVLYIGLMITSDGIFALEFNVRLGDPEAEVLLPRLQTSLLDIADACIDGSLDRLTLSFKPIHAVCVVMASRGYPGKLETGKVITGLDDLENWRNLKVFHAGTRMEGGNLVTAGGRVLAATGWATSRVVAANLVYEVVNSRINFSGKHFRQDIGRPRFV